MIPLPRSVNMRARLRRVLRLAPVVLIGGACSAPSAVTAPVTGAPTTVASPYRGAAFVVDVNTTRRTVKISPPVAGPLASTAASSMSSPIAPGVHASLLGADAIEMRITNYAAGALGAVIPGKVLVTFDLTLYNRLRGVALGTPTFPRPPAGATGVQAFPFELSVLTAPGGVGSSGNEIVVTSPSFGAATASNDWDGEPHSFFNDATCGAGSNDCFRYEPFGTIGAEAVSTPRKVGFLIDPTVRDVRIKLLVAADVRAATLP
jgi:hypothetical protein